MSDTNQWVVTIEGAAPPDEIPWLLVGGVAAAGVGIALLLWRKK